MLKIINDELMSYEAIEIIENGNTYSKLKVVSSNKLQQYEKDSRHDNQKNSHDTPGTSVYIVSNSDKLKPLNREILRISAPAKSISEVVGKSSISEVDFNLPMSVNINYSNTRQPRVEVRCHNQGDDRANIYVIAFPFNGMIRPIPEDPRYRIYKGLIATSAKPIFFNNRKYRKVLYLVVEINKNLFNIDHKYHTDKIDIQLESYALFKDRETSEEKTNCETFVLSITSANGDYDINWDYKIADEAILMNVEPGHQLWTTYHIAKSNSNNRGNKKFQKNNKPAVREGNMIVTTNRNGIRKEISIKNHSKNRQRNFNNGIKGDNIDRMMKDSGMFEVKSDYNQNRGKKNSNGKQKKNRNR